MPTSGLSRDTLTSRTELSLGLIPSAISAAVPADGGQGLAGDSYKRKWYLWVGGGSRDSRCVCTESAGAPKGVSALDHGDQHCWPTPRVSLPEITIGLRPGQRTRNTALVQRVTRLWSWAAGQQ